MGRHAIYHPKQVTSKSKGDTINNHAQSAGTNGASGSRGAVTTEMQESQACALIPTSTGDPGKEPQGQQVAKGGRWGARSQPGTQRAALPCRVRQSLETGCTRHLAPVSRKSLSRVRDVRARSAPGDSPSVRPLMLCTF